MKVDLLFPRTHTKLYETNVIPLGILYLSSALKRAGIETEVIDGNSYSDLRYESVLDNLNGDIIGISSTFFHMKEIKKILPKIKKSGRNIVLGGPGVSSLLDKEEFLKESGIDFLVEGEAEEIFPELVTKIHLGNIDLPGVYYLDGNQLRRPTLKVSFSELDRFFPDREAIDFKQYVNIWEKENGLRGAGIIASRGCPFSCTFCDKSVTGSNIRYRNVDNVLEEIDMMGKQYGVNYVFFFDHLFTLNKKHLSEFSQKKIERGLKFSWGANAHINIMDRDYASLLAESDCRTLHFGVESGSERMLELYGKKINPDNVTKVFDDCLREGINPGAYFIVGAPDETQEDVERSAELISRLNLSFLDVSILAPMPGTSLFEATKHNINFSRLDELDNRFVGSVYGNLKIDPIKARDYLLSRWKK